MGDRKGSFGSSPVSDASMYTEIVPRKMMYMLQHSGVWMYLRLQHSGGMKCIKHAATFRGYGCMKHASTSRKYECI